MIQGYQGRPFKFGPRRATRYVRSVIPADRLVHLDLLSGDPRIRVTRRLLRLRLEVLLSLLPSPLAAANFLLLFSAWRSACNSLSRFNLRPRVCISPSRAVRIW
jgi:hypothetical protein